MARSLRALAHPLTGASIGLLLVNDHLLKDVYPSPLTGKLSDFAGLFFFPYLALTLFHLVTRVLGWAWPPGHPGTSSIRVSPWVSVVAAYLLTAALFSAVKLDPAFNKATSAFLAQILGRPVTLARDSTDVFALVVLVPSFTLLVLTRSSRPQPMRRSLVLVGLASLAVVATSPCSPPESITALVVTEGEIYALTTVEGAVGTAFVSTDAGKVWEVAVPQTLPASLLSGQTSLGSLPKTACVRGLRDVCYRVAGDEKLDVSTDGGRTWQVAWSLPASRRTYMARVASGYGKFLACGKDLDLSANDIVIVGQGEQHTVIVALGNEGVLRGRHGTGAWTRIGVGWSEPTPVSGEPDDLFLPWIIQGETIVALIAMMVAFISFSLKAWWGIDTDGDRPEQDKRGPSPWAIAIVVDLCLLVLMGLANLEALIAFVALPLVVLTMAIAWMAAGWSAAFHAARSASQVRFSLWTASYSAILIGALAWVPFALWVLGWIPGYSAAVIIAIAGVILVTSHAMGRLPKASRPAIQAD